MNASNMLEKKANHVLETSDLPRQSFAARITAKTQQFTATHGKQSGTVLTLSNSHEPR
jgi:hypothetical protein